MACYGGGSWKDGGEKRKNRADFFLRKKGEQRAAVRLLVATLLVGFPFKR